VNIKDKDGICEPAEIEAIMPVSDNFLLFRINLSSSVKLFIHEVGSKIILSTSYEQEQHVSSEHRWGIRTLMSETTDHEFPKRFSYIKRAILSWLDDEVRRARGYLVNHLLEKEYESGRKWP
jgi:hypothetical protein